MKHHSLPVGYFIGNGCAEFADTENSVWFGTTSGEIVTYRLMDRRITVRGSGYVSPVAVLPAPDGLSVLIAERSGLVFSAARDGASRGEAAVIATLENEIAAARLHPERGSLLIIEAGENARLLRVQLADGSTELIADGFTNPVSFVVDEDTAQAVILDRPADGARLVTVDLGTGAQTDLGTAPDVTALVTSPAVATAGVLFASGATGDLTLRSFDGSPDVPGPAVGGEVRALNRWGSLVLAITATSIEAIEWGLSDGLLPIDVPLGPAFVGGWFRAEIDPAAVGISSSDVELVIDEGPLAGSVSAGIEPPSPSGARRLRVLTGPRPGEFHLSAIRKSDGTRLGQARFRVTRHWPDREVGPPVVMTGKTQHFLMWGGGPNGPQNIGNHSAPADWRVGYVFVSTSEKRLPGDLTAMKKEWTDRLIAAGGNSVRNYYEEVSYGKTTVSHAGPIFTLDLEKGWGDYFEQPKNKDTWHGWDISQTGKEAIVGALCDMLADTGQGDVLEKMDAIVFVVETATESLSVVGTKLALPMYVWPVHTKSSYYRKIVLSDGVTTTASGKKSVIFMPSHAPGKIPATKKIRTTPFRNILCHELGHSLGCGDLYNTGDLPAEVEARTIGALDLMDQDNNLPHFSLPNRMRLGWIDANWIERVDFSVNAASRNVTLHAAELLKSGPAAGRKAGIEIRIRDGWNYYFEYRRAQGGQVGDQMLNAIAGMGQMVVGTDVVVLGESGFIAGGDDPVRRPRILLLPVDADGDGPVLDALGEDYEESDVTNVDSPHDFRLRFDGPDAADPNAARVRIEYIAARRADLRLRPAPGNGNWKSPDIDIEGPAGMNVIAPDLEHKIIIRVRNAGTEGARSVRVRVAWLPFTTSPGAWTQFPDPPRQDIAKGQTVEFRVPWTPKTMKIGGDTVEHFCVKADIERYVDPSDPSHDEIVIGNNWAQSNFDTTAVSHESPSERRTTGVAITNHLPREATFLTVADMDSALCRIYLGNAWLRLQPAGTAMVELGYESLAGDPLHGAMFAQQFEKLARGPAPLLSLTSLVLPEPDDQWTSPQTVWGANLSIRIGRRTRIRIEGLFERIVRGHVFFVENDQRSAVTRGRVNVVMWTADRPEHQLLCSDDVNATGRFDAVIPREISDAANAGIPIFAEALYLGAWPWAPARSGIRQVR